MCQPDFQVSEQDPALLPAAGRVLKKERLPVVCSDGVWREGCKNWGSIECKNKAEGREGVLEAAGRGL